MFELVDQSVAFVMSKIAAAVGTRAESNRAPVTYELPRPAVAEAIVNAVAHRDYASNASVQVMLFADRLEIWNPGQLPPSLTPEALRVSSCLDPAQPTHRRAALPHPVCGEGGHRHPGHDRSVQGGRSAAPQFRQEGGQFIQTLWRPKAARPVGTSQRGQVELRRKLLMEKLLATLADSLGVPTAEVYRRKCAAQVAAVLQAASAETQIWEELQKGAGMKHREHFRKAYVDPLVGADWLRRTIPEKPTSRLQEYLATDQGKAWMEEYRTQTTSSASAVKPRLGRSSDGDINGTKGTSEGEKSDRTRTNRTHRGRKGGLEK